MQKEKLTCENCKSTWQRVPSRGRKPKLCPSCIAGPVKVQPSSKPVDQKAKPTLEKVAQNDSMPFPGPSKWACSSCGCSVKIEIDMRYAPTHHCKKRLKRVYALDLIREA